MPDLDSYFKTERTERYSHPLVRLLDFQQQKPEFSAARIQIIRPRAALGFEPAQLSLQFFNKQDQIYDYKTEAWDAELNEALLGRKVRATDESNEIQRFGLRLDAALQQPESRYGDGFFSAVMLLVVDQSPFANIDPVREIRPYISTNRPYDGGHSAEDCSMMIQAALQDQWIALRRDLGYDEVNAERILAGALAYYLDERFSVTDGRKLGWLKSK
ncbi:MAG: hypothetical protein JSS27_06165 [Planctomycetes bacterium]|nr:hypothetical protein [Planctomycetota bacterium]